MLYIETMFVPRLSSRVKRFKQVKPYVWNFSCPLCGDISKGKQKARGYVYPMKGFMGYKCHHCGVSISFGNLLKQEFPDIYKEFVLERYKNSNDSNHQHTDITEVIPVNKVHSKEESFFDDLEQCSLLSSNHSAIKFLRDRQIPEQFWDDIYYCEFIKDFANKNVPDTFKSTAYDHARIVIPYFNARKDVIGFTARAIGNQEPKYLYIKMDEQAERIYGLERVDLSKTIYVTEGPIDSMFLPNAVAVSGASYSSPFLTQHKRNIVIVPDNEPRNREVCANIKSAITAGYNVSLLPATVKEKDINDMVKAGRSPEDLVALIDANVVQGLAATLKYTYWTMTKRKQGPLNGKTKETADANSYRELNRLLSGSR